MTVLLGLSGRGARHRLSEALRAPKRRCARPGRRASAQSQRAQPPPDRAGMLELAQGDYRQEADPPPANPVEHAPVAHPVPHEKSGGEPAGAGDLRSPQAARARLAGRWPEAVVAMRSIGPFVEPTQTWPPPRTHRAAAPARRETGG